MKEESFHLREKIAELEKIEVFLQQPELNLEEAMQKHEVALKLANEITQYLEKAESTLKHLEMKASKEE
jgi:exonuclease VII small subunit